VGGERKTAVSSRQEKLTVGKKRTQTRAVRSGEMDAVLGRSQKLHNGASREKVGKLMKIKPPAPPGGKHPWPYKPKGNTKDVIRTGDSIRETTLLRTPWESK